LLALWNALPGVDKRRKIDDRAALIDQLWSAIERLPDPEPRADPKRPSKQDVVIAMLRQPEGATVDEVASVTGWQRPTRGSSRGVQFAAGAARDLRAKDTKLGCACLKVIMMAGSMARRWIGRSAGCWPTSRRVAHPR